MSKEIELEFIVTKIPPSEPKKMDFGKVTVCSKCGNAIFRKNPTCCGNLMPLKQYLEEVRGEIFDNDKWGFKEETIYN